MAGCSAALALNATAGARSAVWPLYACSAAAAGLAGFESPTRVAAAASVLEPSDMAQMSALWQVLFQTSTVVGPFLAGVVIAAAGLSAAYWADVASFGAAFAGVWLMRPLPPAHKVTPIGLKAVMEGIGHLRGDRALQGIYLIDLTAMVFGLPRALPCARDGAFPWGREDSQLLVHLRGRGRARWAHWRRAGSRT